jgi:hypothetical protein
MRSAVGIPCLQAGADVNGTRSETHMREDLSIFEFELNATERRAVDEIFAPPGSLIGD